MPYDYSVNTLLSKKPRFYTKRNEEKLNHKTQLNVPNSKKKSHKFCQENGSAFFSCPVLSCAHFTCLANTKSLVRKSKYLIAETLMSEAFNSFSC